MRERLYYQNIIRKKFINKFIVINYTEVPNIKSIEIKQIREKENDIDFLRMLFIIECLVGSTYCIKDLCNNNCEISSKIQGMNVFYFYGRLLYLFNSLKLDFLFESVNNKYNKLFINKIKEKEKEKKCEYFEELFDLPCVFLPNLYNEDIVVHVFGINTEVLVRHFFPRQVGNFKRKFLVNIFLNKNQTVFRNLEKKSNIFKCL